MAQLSIFEEENIRQHNAAAHAARCAAPHDATARIVYAQHPEKLSVFRSSQGAPSPAKTIALLTAKDSPAR